ncbi:hypothetical protein CORC01_01761 [Colletotrichum orchidophilum]|uniref:Ecp2 effector protein-like domain-containing protein n=1 Tax=Colletotrichum orchidophilum TaxID=1209926 RepID=A0A1G4BNW7_9PEZI|nr:uncharacterized protein CORC01_01761 [Colletotrichum orchidophilum]OHF03003.1 hypothetical protein CORC01_01761 [Colletotrichum orchidophilum]
MRMILAPVLALAAIALALAVPEHVVPEHVVPEQALVEVAAPIAKSSAITFKAANGSDVVVHVAPGVFMTDDVTKLPNDLGKQFKIQKTPQLMELCTVRASQKDNGDNGTPLRSDCQTLYDFSHSHPFFVYFDNKVDLNRWIELIYVGSCAYHTLTAHRNVVFSSGDIANFLDRSLSRKGWTNNGRMSASGEADCAVYEGDSGFAPVFWRLQQRGSVSSAFLLANDAFVPDNTTTTLKTRAIKHEKPLIVHALDDIPRNTSAFVFNDEVHGINTAEIKTYSKNQNMAKRFNLVVGGPPDGPYCVPAWLSSEWKQPDHPVKSDCEKLFEFLKVNAAKLEFKEKDHNKMIKFTAHETCALGFIPTQNSFTISNRDMVGFLERMLKWDGAKFGPDHILGKMGVQCGFKKDIPNQGEFHLFYRDPKAAGEGHVDPPDNGGNRLVPTVHSRQIEQQGAIMVEPGSPEDMTASAEIAMIPSDTDTSLNWVDVTVTDNTGANITVQLNANLLDISRSSDKKLDTRLERWETPLGPSKRCTGKISLFGGAKPDSPLIADCTKLRNFMSIRRFYFRFNKEEYGNGHATPLAKVDSCHLSWWPWGRDVLVGNMDIDILFTRALALYDPTQTRMRLWGFENCDFADQFGDKWPTKFYIY